MPRIRCSIHFVYRAIHFVFEVLVVVHELHREVGNQFAVRGSYQARLIVGVLIMPAGSSE
jgi:hypothetical protein